MIKVKNYYNYIKKIYCGTLEYKDNVELLLVERTCSIPPQYKNYYKGSILVA